MARGRLRLSKSSRMLLGLCGGLGRFLGIDPMILRLLCVVAMFIFGFVEVFMGYILVALVLAILAR